jgi:hypothetical protein
MQKYLSFILILITLMTGKGATAYGEGADQVSGATAMGKGWMIKLTGVRNDELWQSDMEIWKKENPRFFASMELERKGEVNLYSGILLKDVIALIDDPSGGMPAVFRDALWREGYEITFTAADGYSATINTSQTSFEEILLADTINGEPVSPRIAGKLSSKAWVSDLKEIELSLAPVDPAGNNFDFLLEINGKTMSYSISDLEKMEIYTEDKGSFTNSYGNRTDSLYGGVKLIPLLSEFMTVTAETAVKIIAMDGYEMIYGGDMLLDQNEGDWILAFKENGEYMPEDPGYIRLVKVGPENPNISGHVSARMIKKIATEGQPFRNFEITIVQKDLTEVFDRQTMQSGVITNKNRVSFYDRKKDETIEYMGISLWRLLERPTGYRAVTLEAEDGFSITLSNDQVEGNDGVILAMYRGEDDELLDPQDWPLKIVWDKDAEIVPEGIKSVRNIVKIILVY